MNKQTPVYADNAVDERLSSIEGSYSVVIIGGGINGCGLFRDLCEQDVDCLLIDKNDFCSGASAAPSRLIHGGIKYLETGEFRLVRQSSQERNLLLRNAPHYVKPLETILPIYSRFGGIVSSIKRFFGMKSRLVDRGSIIISIGLHLYDFFGQKFQSLPKHVMLSKKAALSKVPKITNRIKAIGIYYEARVTHAERLGIELLIDGLKANPKSKVLNYVQVVGSGSEGITFRSKLATGEKTVQTAVIVNAGGAWIDNVNLSLGITTTLMSGNKGSHLIIENQALYDALQGRMVYFGAADGRVNLVYPFLGNVIVGSTDIPETDIDGAVCSEEELNYMIEATQEVFPTIPISPDQVRMAYCGVRPLPASNQTDPGNVSRDHSIAINAIPGTRLQVLSLIGGKWTTFRGFAEEAANLILSHLDRVRIRSTANLSIGGGANFPLTESDRSHLLDALSEKHKISRDRADILLERYGTRALDYISILQAPETVVRSCPFYSIEELRWIAAFEQVSRLTDILFRRTDIALAGRLTDAVIQEIALVLAGVMGWNEDIVRGEIAHARSEAIRNRIELKPVN